MTDILIQAAEELGVELNAEQARQFKLYKDLLLEWNKKMNLTAITEERDIILKHFADSLSLFTIPVELDKKDVIDVGTGAGFPGMPIKIVKPGCRLTFLDSLNKRLNFLKAVGDMLQLCNVAYVHGRAEDAAHDSLYRKKFDYVVSRAVAPLPILVEYCLGYARTGGVFLAQKGPDAAKEIEGSKQILKAMGGEIADIKTVHIPFTDINHTIIVINKTRETMPLYPRKQAIIAKSNAK